MNDDCYKKLIKRHEEAAQALVNILQVRLDYPIEPPFISRHRQALVKLSERSQKIAECLLLEDITISENPVQGGSFGDVFRGDMAGCVIAVKVIRVYQESNMDKILKSFSREAVIWRQLSHPNVLPFYGVFRRGVTKLCLVSPWMQNGDMSHFLSQKGEIDCVPLALDVAKGLEYLHSQRVLHGDLKCGNILVSDAGRACLADFGFSTAKDSNSVLVTASSTKGAGTLAWTAPELALGTIEKPDEACDVYSFGMVCYEASMFSGCTPFAGSSIPQVITAIHLGQRPERPDDLQARKRGLTNRIWKIIATCWHKTSGKRFTAGQVVQRLSTLPNRPPDNRPVDDDPRLSRVTYRQPHHPFSILEMISKRESTGTPCIPGSISQIFGLVDLWASDG
ncbi:kinase-like protein [Athelia psychrophila]|uniref:Kinase-like protein n=1 Tax=Athelia psychrophila TaxID=1759441 RepID=A0A166SY50_9AGAM|nr:kinase-like protein [Fibularhizoctonia sp. CBS 109695]